MGEQSSSNHEETDSLIAQISKLALEHVLCTDMPLYTLASNLFFKIIIIIIIIIKVQFDWSNFFPKH